ncbi:transglycosylase SLT domain-containing protein [Streptomyces iconiensis]|uniref:Transglycosylase SLT domain-containing protein n=1 Tax=Streptomyces iconiensis TaxID=1384038 RepID=A0ABT7AA86_9ACTN|nr:transglycosylase SLT domain-containing protein [Streptomyces iconiensis]MDJ1137726.1 transglycosylase SLT domain-containing protein [Streptomyces iconiensis]
MSAPGQAPQHKAPRRFTRLQKVSAATGVAAVGVGALAFGLGAGQDGADGSTARVAGGEAEVKPVAWQAAEHSVGEQRESVSQQSSHADARAKAEARAEAKKRAAAKEKRERAQAEEARRAKAAEAERAAKAAAKKRADHKEAASRSAERKPASAPSGSPQEIARQIVGDGAQFQCFSQIVERESGWNVIAQNPSSGAYGLVQALPGSKMASAGSDWRSNPATQIKWGLSYMNETYGSPCGAWSFWQSHNAY